MGCVQSVTGNQVCSEKIPKKDDSSRKRNPFAKPITDAIKSGELNFNGCSKRDKNKGCKDVYVYQPKNKTCGQFRTEFGIPPNHPIPICKDKDDDFKINLVVIDANDLQLFVSNLPQN